MECLAVGAVILCSQMADAHLTLSSSGEAEGKLRYLQVQVEMSIVDTACNYERMEKLHKGTSEVIRNYWSKTMGNWAHTGRSRGRSG